MDLCLHFPLAYYSHRMLVHMCIFTKENVWLCECVAKCTRNDWLFERAHKKHDASQIVNQIIYTTLSQK